MAAPIPVIVFCCDRPAYLERSLDALFRHDDEDGRRILVSQDGSDQGVADVIARRGKAIEHLVHRRSRPALSVPRWLRALKNGNLRSETGYARISQHYRWAFGQVFDEMDLDSIIVLEDDIEIAADFFSLFRATLPLFDSDPTLWTVSSWNDHGYRGRVRDPERLLRTDFFPGLGWLMTRSQWEEVRNVWPAAHWDNWLRGSGVGRGRSVIYPEISRSFNFGRLGTSGPEFYDQRLATIEASDGRVDFGGLDLGYLMKDRFDAEQDASVGSARIVTEDIRVEDECGDVRILYRGPESYNQLADRFGLMPWSHAAAMPRCSYRGVVSFHDADRMIHLVPFESLGKGQLMFGP